MRSTAAGSSACAPRPYTVSVGKATSPPPRSTFAASRTAAPGASASTCITRIWMQSAGSRVHAERHALCQSARTRRAARRGTGRPQEDGDDLDAHYDSLGGDAPGPAGPAAGAPPRRPRLPALRLRVAAHPRGGAAAGAALPQPPVVHLLWLGRGDAGPPPRPHPRAGGRRRGAHRLRRRRPVAPRAGERRRRALTAGARVRGGGSAKATASRP